MLPSYDVTICRSQHLLLAFRTAVGLPAYPQATLHLLTMRYK